MDTKRALKQLYAFRKHGKSMRLAAESWKNDFEILVSTILSARTRDETTIPIAEKLFKKYPNPKSLARASILDVMNIIKPVNFYKNKANHIIKCSQHLVNNFRGKVPHDFEQLLTLSGVGRKTANVFLSEIGHDSIGVDTHVSYISQKVGWTKNRHPEKIEYDLKILFPRKHWRHVNSTLVRFGKTHTSRKEKNSLIKKIRKIK